MVDGMKRLAISILVGAIAGLLFTVGGASGKGNGDPCEGVPDVEGTGGPDFFDEEDVSDGDLVVTKAGNDQVEFWASDVTVCTGGGVDKVRQGNPSDSPFEMSSPRVFGGNGEDDLSINNTDDDEPVTIRGQGDDDVVNGNRARDHLFGGTGNDWVSGHRESDELHGGPGNDSIGGGLGGDKLFGDEHNDELSGDEGNDRVNGGTGSDRCAGEHLRSCERTGFRRTP